MSDESDFHYSDEDVDNKKHEKIVDNVLSLNKAQHLKRPSRSEPTLHISEFNLVQSVTGKKGSVQLDDLAKVLKNRKKHVEIGKKLESTKRKAHTLPKPLEKPQAERIRRSVGYEKNRFLFDRWEAFVTSNRALAHQVFPLDSIEKVKFEVKDAAKLTQSWKIKSNIEKELEKLETPLEEYHIDDEDDKNEFPLSLHELKEKRKESAKLRAHQSFKEAKARKQNKIKSKKYHRILRKEKIKQKLKEFEELQKTNPEEALKKLGEIERARALERFSLRHKGTGQWAKSKQVRAKYDKESRQVLAQQLQISRDLTQKLKNQDSDSEDDGFATKENAFVSSKNEENPWVNGLKPDKEVSEFLCEYKTFWTKQNCAGKIDEESQKNRKEVAKEIVEEKKKQETKLNGEEEFNKIIEKERKDESSSQCVEQNAKKHKKIAQGNKVHKTPKKLIVIDKKVAEDSLKKLTRRKNKARLNNSSGDWDIDELFQRVERKIEIKLKEKLKQKKTITKEKVQLNRKHKVKVVDKKQKASLAMPSQSKKQIIEEELLEHPLNNQESGENQDKSIKKLNNILDLSNSKAPNPIKAQDIDPEKFMKPKVTELNSAMPDLMIEDDNTEENNQKHIIMEAFEDDDVVQDFDKEKQEEINKDKPKDIDLNLPGWGSWAGAMIDPKKQRKRRRFIVKMPENMPRKDYNKGSLIINEKAATKIKSHLVSELPFPFKTVKDYEASIRASIGNTFVPETAFKKFIRPAVETKMGAIIEPMTKSILMGKKTN